MLKMNHELTAKWHELDKVRVGLKDVVVFRPDLRVADGYIQYSTDGGSTWTNIIAMADLKGDPGTPGTAGHTPVKGKDYWTAADKQEIVNNVLAALPDGTEVSY